MNTADNNTADEEFNELAAQYQNASGAALDKTIDDIISLRADGQLSSETAMKIMKLLIARQISHDIKNGASQTSIQSWGNKPNKMKFLRISYGKTEEHFAI